MNIELVQIILNVDGQPKLVCVPKERESLVLGLLQSVFDDGRIAVKSLPPGVVLIPINDIAPA